MAKVKGHCIHTKEVEGAAGLEVTAMAGPEVAVMAGPAVAAMAGLELVAMDGPEVAVIAGPCTFLVFSEILCEAYLFYLAQCSLEKLSPEK